VSTVTFSLPLLGFFKGRHPPPLGSWTFPSLSYQLLTATAHNNWIPAVLWLQLKVKSHSYVTTDDYLASLSWCQAPIWGKRPDFYYCQTVVGLLTWGSLFDERTGWLFTIATGPRQCSHSWVWVLQDSGPYLIVSNSRLPQPGGLGPHIYIPQEQGGPVIPPGTGFPFCRVLQLAGLRWRYMNPPPHRVTATANWCWL
jgi:hypothetical protein